MHWLHFLQHWLAVHTGTLNEPGPYYGFWSGFGSDIGEVVLIGGLVGIYRKHNCHVKGCWRIAHHPVEGTPWLVCRKHHPKIEEKPTAEQVASDHAAAQ
jgi:hypothetical protein